MEQHVESTLAKYLEFKIFDIFKNRMTNIIQPHCRENSKEDLYKHLFLCPSQTSKKRNFQLHGVLSPFVCLWRTSSLNWNDTFYARSVLKRSFEYDTKSGIKVEEGYLYDLQFDFEIFSSSYYRDFRDKVNQDILDMDRLRYFDVDVKELLTDCTKMNTKVEIELTGIRPTDNTENNRSFDLNCAFTVKISIPYCRGFEYLTGVKLYLNEHLVYQKDSTDVDEND